MVHFRCKCGYSIVDSEDFLPYKAYYLPDEDVEVAIKAVIDLLTEFIEARERGEQAQFLAKHKPWLRDGEVHEVVRNLFSHPTFSRGRPMYECSRCGRLWLESLPEPTRKVSYQSMVTYLPESPVRGILRHEGGTKPVSDDASQQS